MKSQTSTVLLLKVTGSVLLGSRPHLLNGVRSFIAAHSPPLCVGGLQGKVGLHDTRIKHKVSGMTMTNVILDISC